tara:strand:- start:108 stop:473 length:366 start_codon:yes stop_codon:yes gene_type:complete
MSQSQEKPNLQNHVDSIANDLSSGMTYEQCGMDHEDRGCEPDDYISGFDWLQDVLDIEYTISCDGAFLGARVLVAFGGPNIWVDTRNNRIEGHWWGESAYSEFDDEMDIHGACNELFDCMA